MKLFFATGNPRKMTTPSRVLAQFGIELVQAALDIPELQATTSAEVAQAKALWAFGKLGQPVMVADSAFHIDALGGFPGPNVKWVNGQIGLDGYLRLMTPFATDEERSCRFEDALVCVRSLDEPPGVFVRQVPGHLLDFVRGPERADQLSILWRIFVPSGHDKTPSEMGPAELLDFRSTIQGVYESLAAYVLGKAP